MFLAHKGDIICSVYQNGNIKTAEKCWCYSPWWACVSSSIAFCLEHVFIVFLSIEQLSGAMQKTSSVIGSDCLNVCQIMWKELIQRHGLNPPIFSGARTPALSQPDE